MVDPWRDPAGRLHPLDEEQVAAAISRAAGSARCVRVHGAGHSIAGSVGADPGGIELSLDALDRVASVDDLVEVGAGVRFGDDPRDPNGAATPGRGLCSALDAAGRSLPTLAGTLQPTVVGFLQTGSCGPSARWSLHDAVAGLRLIDGRGQVRSLAPGDPLFDAALVGNGLCGVVTAVTLRTGPAYDLDGQIETAAVGRGPVDPFDDAVAGWFLAQEYARLLWWPQADRIVVWTARRAPRDEGARAGSTDPLPRIAGSVLPAALAAGVAARLVERLGPGAVGSALTRAFQELHPPRRFRVSWWRGLAMDHSIDERLLPVRFSEVWLPLDRAGAALRALRALDRAVWGSLAVELYAAPAGRASAWPAGDAPALRVDVFQLARGPDERGLARLRVIWDALRPLGARFHWAKAMPADPGWALHLRRELPGLERFLAARAELDPDGRFLTATWRARLGLDPSPAPPPSPAPLQLHRTVVAQRYPHRIGPPLWFALEPVDEGFLERAPRRIDRAADTPLSALEAWAWFSDPRHNARWTPGFAGTEVRAVDREGRPRVVDERFVGFSLRVRVLASEPGARWSAAIDRLSAPLAIRMVEVITFTPIPTGSRVRFRIGYEPAPGIARAAPLVEPAFSAWLGAMLRGLARLSGPPGAG